MALAAAQVIDGIAARLATVTATNGRVYASRTWPATDADMPYWRVTAQDEAVETMTIGYPAVQDHALQVEATATAAALADLDDTLHALASAGLSALFATQAAAQLTPLIGVDMTLTGIRRDLVTDGQSRHGQVTLQLQATYRTAQNAPETLI